MGIVWLGLKKIARHRRAQALSTSAKGAFSNEQVDTHSELFPQRLEMFRGSSIMAVLCRG
jgi:hypothetical protein